MTTIYDSFDFLSNTDRLLLEIEKLENIWSYIYSQGFETENITRFSSLITKIGYEMAKRGNHYNPFWYKQLRLLWEQGNKVFKNDDWMCEGF